MQDKEGLALGRADSSPAAPFDLQRHGQQAASRRPSRTPPSSALYTTINKFQVVKFNRNEFNASHPYGGVDTQGQPGASVGSADPTKDPLTEDPAHPAP